MCRLFMNKEEMRVALESYAQRKLYLVGAGELGRYLGEYLNHKGLNWATYIDRSKIGQLNGKEILPYDCEYIDKSANFIITSPQNAIDIENSLKDIGITEENIASFENNRIAYELYGEINFLMRNMLDGTYRYCSFGERNPDNVYVVLERTMIYEGILSNVRRFLMGIDYADRNGFIPVIDQVYFPAFEYQSYPSIGYDNPWEYFFEQPGGVGLSEVTKECKNVRYYNMDDSVNCKYLSETLCMRKNMIHRLSHWHKLAKKYIRLNETMKTLVESEYKRLFPRGKKILGIKVREGMWVNIQRKNNRGILAYQPSTDELLEYTKEHFVSWNMDNIFLMCETEEVKDIFVREFGDKVIYKDVKRTNTIKEFMSASDIRCDIIHNDKNDKKRKAMEYLTEVYLLSKCDALIGGDNGATEMACILKGEYEHVILHHEGYTPSFTA